MSCLPWLGFAKPDESREEEDAFATYAFRATTYLAPIETSKSLRDCSNAVQLYRVWLNSLQLKHPKITEGWIISILFIVQFRQNGALEKTMPTLYTALRTHLPKPKARKQQPPTSFGLAMIVSAPELKQRRERIYRLSLVQRFKNIHRPSNPRTVIVIGAGLAGLAAAYELHCIGYRCQHCDLPVSDCQQAIRKCVHRPLLATGDHKGRNHCRLHTDPSNRLKRRAE